MTQFYIGCKQIEAWPEERDGRSGYAVKYPDGYLSWSPKEVFEQAYLPMGVLVTKPNQSTITDEMVDDFIVRENVYTLGGKTTVVIITLANGFELTESSSCVDPANYSEEIGRRICVERIRDRVWHLLGFLLQTARSGIKPGG